MRRVVGRHAREVRQVDPNAVLLVARPHTRARAVERAQHERSRCDLTGIRRTPVEVGDDCGHARESLDLPDDLNAATGGELDVERDGVPRPPWPAREPRARWPSRHAALRADPHALHARKRQRPPCPAGLHEGHAVRANRRDAAG